MTTQTTGQQPQTTAWHWVMTIQTANGVMNTRSAVIQVPRGYTRDKAYRFVLDQFTQEYGQLSVLYFDLQPNQL